MKILMAAVILSSATFLAGAAEALTINREFYGFSRESGSALALPRAFNLTAFDQAVGTLNTVTLTVAGSFGSNFVSLTAPAPDGNIDSSVYPETISYTVTGPSTIKGVGQTFAAGMPAEFSFTQNLDPYAVTGSGNLSINIVGSVTNSDLPSSYKLYSSISFYGTLTYDYTPASTTVPEPASLALLGLGLAGVATGKLRRNQKVSSQTA